MIVTKLCFFQRVLAIGCDANQDPVLRCFKQAISGIFYNDCVNHLEIGCRKDLLTLFGAIAAIIWTPARSAL